MKGRHLQKNDHERTIARQLMRSGTSVAANYRAVGRPAPRQAANERMRELLAEANELLAIFAASQRTARAKRG